MKRCFFIGHRDAAEDIMPHLTQAVERMIMEEEIREFVVGRYGKFDHMAAKAVLLAKREHRDIRLVLMTPYHPAEYPLPRPEGVDEILYPFERAVSPRFAIVRANEQVIRMSSHLIAYVCHLGKARDFLEYARKQNIKIERIGEEFQ